MNKEDYDRFLELEGLRSGGIDSGCSDEFEEHAEEYHKLEKQVLHALQCEERLKKRDDELFYTDYDIALHEEFIKILEGKKW